MKTYKSARVVGIPMTLALTVAVILSVVGTATAQVEIPAGATIDSATLSVYTWIAQDQEVFVHQITSDWQENTVTWNNFVSYDAGVIDSFVANAVDTWFSVDVTDLVRDWLDGTYANYGVLLEQGFTPYSVYLSSENPDVVHRPKLDIDYTTPGGSFSVTIQQQDDVADAYVWENHPDNNYGDDQGLYTGNYNGYEKISLIRFDVTQPHTACGGGGLTPGFWQNKHGLGLIAQYGALDDLNELCLRNEDGSFAEFNTLQEFKAWLRQRNAENMAYQLSGHLAAMYMNVLVGSVNGDALVYIGHEGDMISIYDLMEAAYGELCDHGDTTVDGADADYRDLQEELKDALDWANNNLNWVNPCTCSY